MRRSRCVDAHRMIGVGYSNGGQMILRLIHVAPELPVSAVIVAATMPDRASFLGPFSHDTVRPIPVTLVAGAADRIVPYEDGRMAWWARALFKVGGVAFSAPASYFAVTPQACDCGQSNHFTMELGAVAHMHGAVIPAWPPQAI